jgi:hypothetical protein
MGSPNIIITNKSTQVTKKEETKNLRKPVLTSKVVNLFTRALAPPFIGRRRDFYIPRIPSNLENIPSVNTYMNAFYIPWFAGLISYIYKPATSSHFQPRLSKWRLWLGLFPDSQSFFPKIITHRDSRTEVPSDSWISQVPNLLNLTKFQLSWNIQKTFKPIRLLFSCIIRRSAKCVVFIRMSSWMLPLSRNNIFHVEDNLWHFSRIRQIWRFKDERFLPNSPTLDTWGSGLTPTIRFPEQNLEFW